jgi:hypothetical protein
MAETPRIPTNEISILEGGGEPDNKSTSEGLRKKCVLL